MARILIIEDEDLVRDMLEQMLERAGHEVLQASDGEEGVEVYRRDRPDLVITDIQMPKKDGLDTIRDLKGDSPDLKLIAITGFNPETLEVARQMGIRHTFTKPFHMAELLGAVEELLGAGE